MAGVVVNASRTEPQAIKAGLIRAVEAIVSAAKAGVRSHASAEYAQKPVIGGKAAGGQKKHKKKHCRKRDHKFFAEQLCKKSVEFHIITSNPFKNLLFLSLVFILADNTVTVQRMKLAKQAHIIALVEADYRQGIRRRLNRKPTLMYFFKANTAHLKKQYGTEQNESHRQELGRSNEAADRAAIVATIKFGNKSEDAVAHRIDRERILPCPFRQEHHNRKQQKLESRLNERYRQNGKAARSFSIRVKPCGIAPLGIHDRYRRIAHPAKAAAAKKAAYPAKCMSESQSRHKER
jgi:hypothetical protein